MAESMKDFERELEASFKRIDEGDIISGTVVSVDESGVVLDLKFYAEGFIPVEEFSRVPGFNIKEAVQPGDERPLAACRVGTAGDASWRLRHSSVVLRGETRRPGHKRRASAGIWRRRFTWPASCSYRRTRTRRRRRSPRHRRPDRGVRRGVRPERFPPAGRC